MTVAAARRRYNGRMVIAALVLSVLMEVDVATLRAEGPAAVERLVARWERMADGEERAALAELIDRVAAQRHATASRLYWHTDLDAARAAARATGRPILMLRLLGRLDEEWSCANSRYFRVALYANREISALLRGRFVLYWSSERPAPRLTVDYGDGRRLERTITGNSAHLVLDEEGRAIDVIPGLYAPAAFRDALGEALALHRAIAGKRDDARRRVIAAHHGRRMAPGGGMTAIVDDALAAQRLTVSKAAVELPVLRAGGWTPGGVGGVDDDEAWWARGQRFVPDGPVLDGGSLALIARLAPGVGAATIARFERDLVADTAKNELAVRPAIRARLAERDEPLGSLLAWLYDDVFRTPAADPWLGLRGDRFVALPDEGVVRSADGT